MYLAARILDESHIWDNQMQSEKDPDIPLAVANQIARTSERVTAIEVKHEALRDDTRSIRESIHGIRNEMTKFAFEEAKCSASLDSVSLTVADHSAKLDVIQDNVQVLINVREQQKGIWWAIVRVCTITVTTFSFLAASIAGVAWILEHHLYINVR